MLASQNSIHVTKIFPFAAVTVSASSGLILFRLVLLSELFHLVYDFFQCKVIEPTVL